jgi:hypothetical protein
LPADSQADILVEAQDINVTRLAEERQMQKKHWAEKNMFLSSIDDQGLRALHAVCPFLSAETAL